MKNLNIACYAYNFDNYDALLDLLSEIPNAGAELSMHYGIPEYSKHLLAQADKFSGRYVTFHGPYLEVELTSPLDSQGHTEALEAFGEALAIYREFSADSILMHTNQRSFDPEEAPQLRKNAIATITKMAEMAQNANANLLVENVGEAYDDNLLFPEDEYIALFDSLPDSVGALIDIGHASLNGWDMEKVLSALGTRIKSYHLHNNDGKGDIHRPLFEEGMNMDKPYIKLLLSLAERYSPDADWILEFAPGEHITKERMLEEVRQTLMCTNGCQRKL